MKRGDGFLRRADLREEDPPMPELPLHARNCVDQADCLLDEAIVFLTWSLGDSHRAAAHIADELVQYLKPGANRTPVSAGKRKQVFERDAYRCVECDSWKDLEVDHVIPVSKGGTNAIRNLQTLCKACNIAKKDRV